MVRLLAIRALIAALTRAIALSDRLKPATWKYLAVGQTALLVFSVWGIYKSQEGSRPHEEHVKSGHFIDPDTSSTLWHAGNFRYLSSEPDGFYAYLHNLPPLIRSQGIAREDASLPYTYLTPETVQLSATATDPDGDTLLYTYSTTGGRVTGDGPNATLDLTGVAPGTYTVTVEVDDGCGCIAFTGLAVVSAFKPYISHLASSGDWPNFPRLPRYESIVVLEHSSPEATSIVSTLQLWALLFSTALNIAGAISSLVLAWIGYNRSKTDQLLKEAQLLKLQLEMEQLRADMERTRGEPRRSGIIIVSG